MCLTSAWKNYIFNWYTIIAFKHRYGLQSNKNIKQSCKTAVKTHTHYQEYQQVFPYNLLTKTDSDHTEWRDSVNYFANKNCITCV